MSRALLVVVPLALLTCAWFFLRWAFHDSTNGTPVHDVVPIGAVEPLVLTDLEGRSVPITFGAEHAATVIWFWSVLCPCVEECEERIRALATRQGPRGVRLLVVHPIDADTAADIEEKRKRLGSPYVVYRDPTGWIARRFGITNSGSVVVLDGRGRLRYRGAFDDDLDAPRVPYAAEALDALLTGKDVARPEVVPTYGCVYRW